MLCPQDYKLIPLDKIAHDPALKESYLRMLRELYREHYATPEEERFILKDITEVFSSVGAIERDFERYLDFMNYRRERAGTYKWAVDCALVDRQSGEVAGAAGIYIRPYQEEWAASGYDVIHPGRRGEGLGKLIMAMRMDYASEIFGARSFHFWVEQANKRSVDRIERLREAGMVRIIPCGTGLNCIAPLPKHYRLENYLEAFFPEESQMQVVPEPAAV